MPSSDDPRIIEIQREGQQILQRSPSESYARRVLSSLAERTFGSHRPQIIITWSTNRKQRYAVIVPPGWCSCIEVLSASY